jgi:hypothetical protein
MPDPDLPLSPAASLGVALLVVCILVLGVALADRSPDTQIAPAATKRLMADHGLNIQPCAGCDGGAANELVIRATRETGGPLLNALLRMQGDGFQIYATQAIGFEAWIEEPDKLLVNIRASNPAIVNRIAELRRSHERP